MTFRTRNLYYLRISKGTVLPIYIYLDKRHVEWMSDTTLQHVMADLRPNILPKLKTETDGGASSKDRTVDTHRGDTYQFCYFVRNTEPHSVVIKMRNFKAAIPQRRVDVPPLHMPSKSKTAKRPSAKDNKGTPHTRKKRKMAGNGRDDNDELLVSEEDPASPSSTFGQVTQRSMNKETLPNHINNDEDNDAKRVLLPGEQACLDANRISDGGTSEEMEAHLDSPPLATPMDVEEKPKPMLSLKYQGFSIYGYCMCLVVEPWPSIRSASVTPSLVPTTDHSPHARLQAKVPLFLPDDSEDALLAFDHDDGGMMVFSQVLHNVGESRAGAVIDDEETEGNMFYGDADERRGL